MKTNADSTASLEPSTHAADFAQRVNVNEARLTSELRPHYDFLHSSGAASLPFVADLMLAVNGKERRLAEYNVSIRPGRSAAPSKLDAARQWLRSD